MCPPNWKHDFFYSIAYGTAQGGMHDIYRTNRYGKDRAYVFLSKTVKKITNAIFIFRYVKKPMVHSGKTVIIKGIFIPPAEFFVLKLWSTLLSPSYSFLCIVGKLFFLLPPFTHTHTRTQPRRLLSSKLELSLSLLLKSISADNGGGGGEGAKRAQASLIRNCVHCVLVVYIPCLKVCRD